MSEMTNRRHDDHHRELKLRLIIGGQGQARREPPEPRRRLEEVVDRDSGVTMRGQEACPGETLVHDVVIQRYEVNWGFILVTLGVLGFWASLVAYFVR